MMEAITISVREMPGLHESIEKEEEEEGGFHHSAACCSCWKKAEVIYLCHVILVYIIIVICLINLILASGLEALWSALLSGSIGYLLPAPSIPITARVCKQQDESLVHNASEQQLPRLLSKQHDDDIYDPASVDVRAERRLGSGSC